MRISVIGCGYLGAVHAAAMASIGHEVIGVDVDEEKIARLGRGEAPFHEPGFEALLREQLAGGRLRFATGIEQVRDAEVHFVTVGTPQVAGGWAADVVHVDAAVAALAAIARPGSVVVGKSTVPVGTAARLAEALEGAGSALVWNPEFLREGFAVRDTLEPDRLVYGVRPGAAGVEPTLEGRPEVAAIDAVYAPMIARGTPRIVTDWATAELVKVSANAFLATKISFINAMAEIAEATGADVTTLADAIGLDARIGRRFLNAGVGFGGGCLPKDIRAFAARAEELGLGDSLAFLREVDAINLRRRDRVVELVLDALGERRSDDRVAVLGLAFKPDSDDIRDSPALDIAVRLHGLGVDVVATDPAALDNARGRYPRLGYVATAAEAVRGAAVVVLLTEWADYRGLDPVTLRATAGDSPTIVDGRNVLDPATWRAAGWAYRGMGRG
ncbi:MAG: UDP-glucose 6-dehydrogenase [Micrococcales bacterium 73-13]|nr:MAG: UDP-glucose 6-dehydrogenase [Micrococcales bacterium 73-13]